MALECAAFGVERLPKQARTALMVVAVVGTAAYVGSFLLLRDSQHWGRVGLGMGASAVIAWVVLGLVLQVISRQSIDPLRRWGEWQDSCLITMGIGQAIFMISVAINLLSAWRDAATPLPGAGLHVAVLVAADTIMGAVFVLRERRLGQPLWIPGVLWAVVLNGTFVLAAWVLSRPLGYG